MTQTFFATFDGQVLRPEGPIDLAPNTRVAVTVEPLLAPGEPYSSLQVAESLNLDGPPDWSEKLEEYLYGDLKDSSP